MRKITKHALSTFHSHLLDDEKAEATINKYLHDIEEFKKWLGNQKLCKSTVLAYKNQLCGSYAPASVNAALSSLNSFFNFMEWHDLRVKNLRIQRKIFAPTDKELTKQEYERILMAARQKKRNRLFLLIQTICSTGIRVSELQHITIDAINIGIANINCKGKCRTVFLPHKLCNLLKRYAKSQKITHGAIFISRSGKTLDRSNIWSDMKKLCEAANVPKEKVFPHNLRHLFARTYYNIQKDIVRLADILGHCNVNTTRIYTMESGETHHKQIQELGLLRYG